MILKDSQAASTAGVVNHLSQAINMSIHSMVGAQVLPSARSETAVRQCTARKPFVLACGKYKCGKYILISPGTGSYLHPIGAAHGKQQPQRYVPKAACEVAQHLVGGLAAAAVLLVPQAAMANARLPPVDSGKT